MSMRRPRIKASANLMNSKRKPKVQLNNQNKATENEVTTKSFEQKTESTTATAEDKNLKQQNERKTSEVDHTLGHASSATIVHELPTIVSTGTDEVEHPLELIATCKENGNEIDTSDTSETLNDIIIKEVVAVSDFQQEPPQTKEEISDVLKPLSQDIKNKQPKIENTNEQTSFKCPPNVIAMNRSNSHNAGYTSGNVMGSDDVFHSDLEDVNVIQMDLQNSHTFPLSPMSPSKSQSRQRIRATPIFGQRRNSFVGTSPSPHTGDELGGDFTALLQHRRERHYSASLSQSSNTSLPHLNNHHHTLHKYIPTIGRIRTESGCSAFSDSYAPSSKSRKTDDQLQHHRALSRRDHEARFNNGVIPDKSTLKMFDLIYYNPVTNPMEQKPNMANIKQETTKAEDAQATVKNDLKLTNSSTSDGPAVIPVPQLKLDSNGELILDDKSLEIETTAEQEARKALASSSLIYLDENTGMNGFYKKQKRTKEWPPEETIKFYRCLQTVGTDFSLMGQLFPNRSRRDLKLKFKKEERVNLALINKAILYPKIFNIDQLKVQLESEEQERAEAERKWKEIKAQEAKNIKKPSLKTSSAARALAHGDDIYQNENVTKTKFSKRARKTAQQQRDTPCPSEKIVSPKDKKKRKRQKKNHIKIENICFIASNDDIKNETIKVENNQQQLFVPPLMPASIDIDSNQLEVEIAELLHNNQPMEIVNEPINSFNNHYFYNPPQQTIISENNEDIYESKSLVNLDNGTVTFVNDVNNELIPNENDEVSLVVQQEVVQEEEPAANDDSAVEECDMDEGDIQQILTELAEGSMVLVSTLDPNNSDKVLNEIYLLDKNTGELCDSPLNIPDSIVQCILTVMS